jgi:hypothetical protein
MFRSPENIETDIEASFPASLYIEAFNAAYAKELNGILLSIADLPKHPRMVERTNQWLAASGISLLKDGGFNHYRVAQALLPRLTLTAVSTEDRDRFQALFNRVNQALSA